MNTVIVYSGDPDLSTTANAGYSTHLRGMISGFRDLGVSVAPMVRGDRSERRTPDRDPSDRTSTRRIVGWARGIVPNVLWRILRDVRQLKADRDGRAALSRLAKSVDADVIYERYSPFHIAGITVGAALDIPVVLEVNSPLEERADFGRNSWLEPLLRRRLARTLRSASLLVFVSSALRDHYLAAFGRALAPSIVVPNATSAATIPDEAQSAASELTSQPDTTYLIFVGSMIRWHRVDVLLEALQIALRENDDLHLLVVGDGELRPEYESMAERMGLNSRVTFTGAVERELVAALLSRSTIALMVASNWWGSPVKLFEYAEAGCAIIAPDTAPVRETFEVDREVLLTEGTPETVAGAILRLIDDPGLSSSLGQLAQRRVRADHTWTRAADRVLSALRR